jgi:hypothetical protein
MSAKNPQKTIEAKSKRNYPKIIVSIIILIAFCLKYKDIQAGLFKDSLASILFIVFIDLFMALIFFQIIWAFIGETTFSIVDNSLIVKTGIPYIKSTREYLIDKISDVKLKSIVNSTNFFGIKMYSTWGVPGYDFFNSKSTVISFNYNGKEVILGGNSSQFDIDELKGWID